MLCIIPYLFFYLIYFKSSSGVDWYSLHRSQELEKAGEILLFSSLQLTLRWERGICCSKEKNSPWAFLLKKMVKQSWVKNKLSLGIAKFLSVVFVIENTGGHACVPHSWQRGLTVIWVAPASLCGLRIGTDKRTSILRGFRPSPKRTQGPERWTGERAC